MPGCDGPLIWYDVPPTLTEFARAAAVLECATCGYITMSGNFHDEAHLETPLLREGLAAW